MQDTRKGLRVCEHASDLAHGPVVIDRVVLAGIHESIPIGHVGHIVIVLETRVVELGEEAARVQVVVVFVDLANSLTDLKVGLEVIHPMALGAVDGDTTVGTFKVRVGWRLA